MLEHKDLQKISEGARLQGFEPYLKDYVEKMERTLVNKVFRALEEKTLTPEVALYAWMELLSYRRLLRKFQQQVQIGIAVGEDANASGEMKFSPTAKEKTYG